MIRAIDHLSVDVLPQAVIGLPVDRVLKGLAKVSKGVDDFDYFEGAFFKLDDALEIAVRHYRGHPKDTATVYIDSRENDVEAITLLIRKILSDLDVPLAALQWERRDNPEL